MKMKANIIEKMLIALLVMISTSLAQHRGDDLSFQGLSFPTENGVRAVAMGGAFTAQAGDVSSLFWNPAGLAKIQSLQITSSALNYNKTWRENQVYRTNRYFLTLPFYLEKLYIPDPKNNGRLDWEIFNEERDSTYIVSEPAMGNDVFSEDAAEWQNRKNSSYLSNIAVALPLTLAGKSLAIAGAYNRHADVLDFDRNDTYLDPHLGYKDYGDVERIANDTLRVNWSVFERSRYGTLNSVSLAAAYELHKNIQLGVGFSSFSGDADDSQSLNRVGWFELYNSNRFVFSYDTLSTVTKGTSKFSAARYNLGLLLSFDHFSVGINLNSPYTIERAWDYTTTTVDSSGIATVSSSGTDKFKVPMAYRLGITVQPVQSFSVSMDYESIPYSRGEFSLVKRSTTHRPWVDQSRLSFGLEYKPWQWLGLLGGYKNISATFIPDGAAFKNRGPLAESYSAGISLDTGFGRLDAAYEFRTLKYYDSYYSNTNYAYEGMETVIIGYTISF